MEKNMIHQIFVFYCKRQVHLNIPTGENKYIQLLYYNYAITVPFTFTLLQFVHCKQTYFQESARNVSFANNIFRVTLPLFGPQKGSHFCKNNRIISLNFLQGAINKDDMLIPQPPRTQLSSANIDRHGVYLMDTGEYLYLYVGRAANDQLIHDIFNVPTVASLPETMVGVVCRNRTNKHTLFKLQCLVMSYGSVRV